MNHLWSPWRMTYIEGPKSETDCVFCGALESPDGVENLIVHRGRKSYVILNRFPYTSGHLMVVPYDHVPSLEGLEPETRAEMIELTAASIRVLGRVYQPEGYNIGANIGEPAGAGIVEHIHFHVVPRWTGDTSFMSALAETRVLPEALTDTYRRVREEWKAVKDHQF